MDGTRCRQSVHTFMKRAFRVLEPNTQFRDGWFYELVCEHAQAFVRGEIRRLLVIHPPSTYKSGLWAATVPAFGWLERPWLRYLVGGNEQSLVDEFGTRCRDIVESDWYQKTFTPDWRLRGDQNAKRFYGTTKGGVRRGVSTGSKVGGKKGHLLILDDIHDADQVHSPVIRKSEKDWFRNTFFDRQIDPAVSGVAVIGHRTDTDDLQSELSTEGGWEILHIPECWEERFRKTYPVAATTTDYGRIHSDPRTVEGTWLRPNYGEVQKDETNAGSPGNFDTKHQGDPKTSEGSLFPSEMIGPPLKVPPVGTTAVRFWDTAASIKRGSSWTSGVLIGRQPSGRWLVLDVIRKRLKFMQRDNLIVATAHDDRRIAGVSVREIVIEHPGGSGGVQASEMLVSLLSGFVVRIQGTSGHGTKLHKAGPFASQWQAGNVDFIEGDWNKGYKQRMENAHNSTDQDDMDASAGSFNAQVAFPPSGPDAVLAGKSSDSDNSTHAAIAGGVYSAPPDSQAAGMLDENW